MDPALPELLRILDLESIEQNLFRAHHPSGTEGRVFGGQIMAQALMAAGRTLPTATLAAIARPLAAWLFPATRRPDRTSVDVGGSEFAMDARS